MRLNLGMINTWDEKGFKDVASRGLGYVEFCVNPFDENETDDFLSHIGEIKALSAKYGVKIGSMGRWGEKIQNDDGTLNEERFKYHTMLIKAASELSCPVYNCNIDYNKNRSYRDNCEFSIMALRRLVEYGKKLNVKIAVYNCGGGMSTPKEWEIVIPAVPGLGIKYDISHAMERNADYMAEIEDWAEHFYHFHLKGCGYINGVHYDDPPIGLDDINWGAVFTMLYTKGYRGMVSLEPHSGYWQGGMGSWGVDYSVKFAKQFIMPDGYED